MHQSSYFEEHAEDDDVLLPTHNAKAALCFYFFLSTDFQMLGCSTPAFLKDSILQQVMTKLLRFQMTMLDILKIFFFFFTF